MLCELGPFLNVGPIPEPASDPYKLGGGFKHQYNQHFDGFVQYGKGQLDSGLLRPLQSLSKRGLSKIRAYRAAKKVSFCTLCSQKRHRFSFMVYGFDYDHRKVSFNFSAIFVIVLIRFFLVFLAYQNLLPQNKMKVGFRLIQTKQFHLLSVQEGN